MACQHWPANNCIKHLELRHATHFSKDFTDIRLFYLYANTMMRVFYYCPHFIDKETEFHSTYPTLYSQQVMELKLKARQVWLYNQYHYDKLSLGDMFSSLFNIKNTQRKCRVLWLWWGYCLQKLLRGTASWLPGLLIVDKGLVSWAGFCRLQVRVLFLYMVWPLCVCIFSLSLGNVNCEMRHKHLGEKVANI